MVTSIRVGSVLANKYKVKRSRKDVVLSQMSNPIIDARIIELETDYESGASLGFYTFLHTPPPVEQWSPIVERDLENAHILPMWKPSQIKQQCITLPYKVRDSSGSMLVVTQMLAAKNNTVVSSKLWWSGFPRIKKFFVGFKPGMKQRTEELLLAGLYLVF